MSGPLSGIRVIEMAAIGPVPFCGMLLADMGAEVVRIDRVDGAGALDGLIDVCARGKQSVAIDLKDAGGADLVLRLAASADVLLEGFRPGVAERLGIGPIEAEAANPRLVYGRMTGWGQFGPLASSAGHDINYISLTGALHAIGGTAPVVPLNLIGDYGGGALYLAVGVLAALYARGTKGKGQVVDAAMIDGAANLMTPTYQLAAAGLWADTRADNLLDGRAPFYRTYETADGKHMAVGALETRFYAELLSLLQIDSAQLPNQYDRAGWDQIGDRLADEFATRDRDHWAELFAGTDACVTPVLSLEEAPNNAHNLARSAFVGDGQFPDPAPAPRFPATAPSASPQPRRTLDCEELLGSFGIAAAEVARLVASGVVAGGK